jgi:hypothetical protein
MHEANIGGGVAPFTTVVVAVTSFTPQRGQYVVKPATSTRLGNREAQACVMICWRRLPTRADRCVGLLSYQHGSGAAVLGLLLGGGEVLADPDAPLGE